MVIVGLSNAARIQQEQHCVMSVKHNEGRQFMKNAGQVCKLFLGIFGILGIALLTSCELWSSPTEDIVTVTVVNQTGEPLAIYRDNADSPEITVAAHDTQFIFTDAGTHQLKWQGATIQGTVEVTIPQNEGRTLTIWGSGNAYSLQ